MQIDLSGSDLDIEKWIWQNLIPDRGQASSVQGEILRCIEALRWEAQENGNINWDRGFEIYLEFIHENLCNEMSLATKP